MWKIDIVVKNWERPGIYSKGSNPFLFDVLPRKGEVISIIYACSAFEEELELLVVADKRAGKRGIWDSKAEIGDDRKKDKKNKGKKVSDRWERIDLR